MSATPEPSSTATPAEAAPAAGGGKLKLIMAGGAAVAGIALGFLLVGPMLSGGGESKPAPAEKASHGAEAETGHGESRLVRIDNVVVNPAGSEGMRFIMASVAFEVSDAAAETRLRNADIQVRDAINGVFERQTMAELTQEGARDSLRIELAAAVAPFLAGAGVKVFLPQFVIQ